MRLEQWGVGKEHYRMASEYPELVLGRVVLQERSLSGCNRAERLFCKCVWKVSV